MAMHAEILNMCQTSQAIKDKMIKFPIADGVNSSSCCPSPPPSSYSCRPGTCPCSSPMSGWNTAQKGKDSWRQTPSWEKKKMKKRTGLLWMHLMSWSIMERWGRKQRLPEHLPNTPIFLAWPHGAEQHKKSKEGNPVFQQSPKSWQSDHNGAVEVTFH